MATPFTNHYRCVLTRLVRQILAVMFAATSGTLAHDGPLPSSPLQAIVRSNPHTVAPVNRSVSSGTPWTAATACPANADRYAFAQDGENFYEISGVSTGPNTTNVWRYNSITNIWTKRASIPTASQGPAGAFLNGKIYVVTGDGTANAFYIYNVGPVAPTPVQLAGYTQVGQYLYVVGGFTSTVTNSIACMRFDMANNAWTTGPTFTPQTPTPARASTLYPSSNQFVVAALPRRVSLYRARYMALPEPSIFPYLW